MRNKFGIRGTTATYRYIEELSRNNNIIVIDTDNSLQKQNLVHRNHDIEIMTINNPRNTKSQLVIYNTIKLFNPDIVYIFNYPHTLDYLFSMKHIFPKVKWVIDFRSPLLVEKNDIRKKVRNKYFYVQFYIDAIFTHSRHSARTWIPFLMRKVSVIPIGTDVDKFIPQTRSQPVFKCKKFVYIGSLHNYRKLDRLIKWFNRASIVSDELILDIYGSGPAEQELSQLIMSLKAEKTIRLCGQLDQDILFQRICSYDAGIAYVPYEKYNKAPTLKSFEYVAAGLHVLASDTAAHKKQMQDYDLKFDLFTNTERSFLQAIGRCAQQGASNNQIRSNLLNVRQCDFKTIVQTRLTPLLTDLAGTD